MRIMDAGRTPLVPLYSAGIGAAAGSSSAAGAADSTFAAGAAAASTSAAGAATGSRRQGSVFFKQADLQPWCSEVPQNVVRFWSTWNGTNGVVREEFQCIPTRSWRHILLRSKTPYLSSRISVFCLSLASIRPKNSFRSGWDSKPMVNGVFAFSEACCRGSTPAPPTRTSSSRL